MKIDSGLSGYGYSHRSYEIDRTTEEAPQRETESRQRSAFALTGSSTFLSQSLASALWAVEGSSDYEDGDIGPQFPVAAPSIEWVEGAYQEFADFN
ncbi:hypothetical protein GAO09_24795 [Rhizobiales bacterium RZME27]|uniref:Uncharacterized protein n=1 Tax=Endobacterium cereale TaxID=2663029 RepID=A0A6A8AEQ9_9HYPH|nr:hypothetical protein [Endobacterium cereale]MEB2847410.1 hypothetical protein [Endobacterium cereale]MQY49259.1 hypothetical protein [Endobacterium cereale]